MNRLVPALVAVSLIGQAGCSRHRTDRASEGPPHVVTFASAMPRSERVSLVRVLANPDAMDGKAVTVGGYMHLEFEGNHLCLHRDDFEQLIVTNCVWISVPDEKRAMELNDRYVSVEGVVNARRHGHMGLFQAALEGVTSIGSASRADLERQRNREIEESKKARP